MKNWIILLALFAIGSLVATGQSETWNLDFEEWDLEDTTPSLWHDTTVVANRRGLFPPKWHCRSNNLSERTGMGQTTDATSGDYAVALSGFYSYYVMRMITGRSDQQPGWPIDFRPNRLTGDYKAVLLGDCDSLRTYVDVFLTRHNHESAQRDTIGRASAVLLESDAYQPFQLDILYHDALLTPDTVIIVLAKERFGTDVPPECLECSHVFFDNLSLTTVTTAQTQLAETRGVIIYPNPANQWTTIESSCAACVYDLAVFDVAGKIIATYNAVTPSITIDTGKMPAGRYSVRVRERLSGEYWYESLIVE